MSERKEHCLIQTYLRVEGFHVSTGYRQSSVMVQDPPWYYETLVWKWDEEKRDRTDIIFSEDSGSRKESVYKRHAEIVAKLIRGDSLEED